MSRFTISARTSLPFLVTKPSGRDEELPIFLTQTLSIHLKKGASNPARWSISFAPVPLYKLLHHLFRHSVRHRPRGRKASQPDTNQQTASAILRGPPSSLDLGHNGVQPQAVYRTLSSFLWRPLFKKAITKRSKRVGSGDRGHGN